MTLAADAIEEVHAMHEALERWFVAGDADAFDRVGAVLADDFVIVDPTGCTLDRAELLDGLSDVGASRVDATPAFDIEVRNAEARVEGGDCCLVTYEEWQSGGDTDTGRISSSLFRRADGPKHVEWVHLHETWLEAP